MKNTAFILIAVFVFLTGAVSCIYRFDADISGGQSNILVVEGDIIAGDESSFILSRSNSISDLNEPVTYVWANEIYVESEDGSRYPADTQRWSETGLSYVADTRDIDADRNARLVISLPGDSIYVSDWVSFRPTPPLDSLSWEIPEDKSALNIYVYTHSDDSQCKYFKWDFTEDWELTSYYWAYYIYDDDARMIYEMPQGENRYYCWNSDISSAINIHSTEKLSSNVISHHLVTSVPRDNRKVQYLYSINVIQKAISEEEYKYWETLQNNTENTGDIFSPQPNELRGNIRFQGEDDIPVIGYIGACTSASKRLFVDCSSKGLYSWGLKTCYDSLVNEANWHGAYSEAHLVPYQYDVLESQYVWSPVGCADCRTAGTKNKPSFWPTSHK